MKLKELKVYFSEITENIKFKYEEITEQRGNQATPIAKFSNLTNFRKGINAIEKTKLLNVEIEKIRNSGIFSTTNDILKINVSEGRILKTPMDELLKIVTSLNQTFSDLSGTTRDNSVSIKLPDISDFQDLSKVSSTFHTILSQSIINDEIKGQVKIV